MRTRTRFRADLIQAARAMPRLRLTPQKSEFFDLYSQASANAVEISRLLVELLDRFPDGASDLVATIKELEHEGDRLTHEVVHLLNSTFVTPFDRDDMYRLAGALDDICDHIDEAADNLGSYGVKPRARQGARAGRRDPPRRDEARRGGRQARGLQGLARPAGRAARARGRGRPARARRGRRAVPLDGDDADRRSSAGRTSTSGSRRRSTRCENAADVLEAILVKNR